MPVTKRLQDLPKDLDRKISADFNELLQEIVDYGLDYTVDPPAKQTYDN